LKRFYPLPKFIGVCAFVAYLFPKIPRSNEHRGTFTQARVVSAIPGPEIGSGRGVQDHLMPEGFETFYCLTHHRFVIALLEILDA